MYYTWYRVLILVPCVHVVYLSSLHTHHHPCPPNLNYFLPPLDSQVHPGVNVHIVQWKYHNCYAHSVNWRPSKGIFLQLAPDVAGTVCICQACGDEYNEGFIPVSTPQYSPFPASYQTQEVKKVWEWGYLKVGVKVTTIRTTKELKKLLNYNESNEIWGRFTAVFNLLQQIPNVNLSTPCTSCRYGLEKEEAFSS